MTITEIRIITEKTKMNLDVEYRNLPHNGGKVSAIGIGAACLHEAAPQEIKGIVTPAAYACCICAMIKPQKHFIRVLASKERAGSSAGVRGQCHQVEHP